MAGLGLLLSAVAASAAPVQTQVLSLQAGWNAVYLRVTPTNPAPEAVFQGLPLESAWGFVSRPTSADFIQDAAEPAWNSDRWSFFLPTNRVESVANRLSAVFGYQPYLLKLTNAATWIVTGFVTYKRIDWDPDAYNLVGLPVDPVAPPTFQTFFGASAAHYTATTGQLKPIYRLNSSGQWTLVTASTVMRYGEALWVYCQGGSTYQGPLEVQLDAGDRLDFGDAVDSLNLRLVNPGASSSTVTLSDLLTPGTNALAYAVNDPAIGLTWPPLPSPLSVSVGAAATVELRLAVKRLAFPGTNYETLLSISNGAGVRQWLPVAAAKSGLAALASNSDPTTQAKGLAGLWVGSASVTSVSVAHSGTLVTNGFDSQGRPLTIERVGFDPTPRPVKTPAELRLLIHVDATGTARLLKQVIQMWQPGTSTNDPDGHLVAATPGHQVLVTDDALIPQFQGVLPRDNTLVGRRLSTVAFDFPGPFLPMEGTFAINQQLTVTNFLDKAWPTNPFRHKYHPDHQAANSYDITRVISLQLAPPGTNAPPEYGYRELQGTYQEMVRGLHQTNIFAAGTFQLQRVSQTPTLNQ